MVPVRFALNSLTVVLSVWTKVDAAAELHVSEAKLHNAFIPPASLEVVVPQDRVDFTAAALGEGAVAARQRQERKNLRQGGLTADKPIRVVPEIVTRSERTVAASANSIEEDIPRERHFTSHLRAYCSASFAGGLTVGIVGTLLVLSLGSRLPEKLATFRTKADTPHMDADSSVAPVEAQVARRQIGSCTDSVESIHCFIPRCGFLVAMLLVQSLSSLMLAGFEELIHNHPSIVFFLTMVVGTGGNVGGQSVVLTVRRLAYGEEVSLLEQFSVGVRLSMVLAPLALFRAYLQGTKLAVCFIIGIATILIVIIAALLGTALPRLLHQMRVDPAHATPVIQVVMDMVGVLVTCSLGYVVLDTFVKMPAS